MPFPVACIAAATQRRKGQNAAAAYRAKVLATSPIAYWPLNEASGAVAVCLNDSDLNGSYSGPTLANAAGPFAPDMAPYFDGENGNVANLFSAALAALWNGAAYSLMIWFKSNSIAEWTDGRNREIWKATGGSDYLEFRKREGRTLWTNRYIAGAWDGVQKGDVVPTGWTCAVVTCDESSDELKLFLNGAQVSTTDAGLGSWANALTALTIGQGVANYHWHGWLSHVALWNRALSALEVQALADYQWSGFRGLLLMFDDGLANMYTGFQYASARDVVATAYVYGIDPTAGSLSVEQLQAMQAAGWIIASHTTSSTPLHTLSLEAQTTALGDARDWLIAQGFTAGSLHVAYPGGGDNADTVTAIASLGILTGRDTGTDAIVDPKTVWWNHVPCALMVENSHSVADVQAVINEARSRGHYCVILFHGLVDATPGTWSWLNSQWQSLIDWIVSEGLATRTIADLYAAG